MGASACLSLCGSAIIIYSAMRFKELSKRFFAIRLIFFLTVADGIAAFFNVLGAFVDVPALLEAGRPSFLCEVQAGGLLYFNLASIMHAVRRSKSGPGAAVRPAGASPLPPRLVLHHA